MDIELSDTVVQYMNIILQVSPEQRYTYAYFLIHSYQRIKRGETNLLIMLSLLSTINTPFTKKILILVFRYVSRLMINSKTMFIRI